MRISDWSSDVCSSDLADDLLDRDRGIDAVLVEEVDRVDAEPLERAFARGAGVGGRAVDAGDLLALEPEAEFGRDDQPVALALDRLAEQFLVREGAIDLRGVEEGDAKVDRAVDRARRFVDVGGLAIKDVAAPDHRHAADADRGDFEAVAELAIFHGASPMGSFSTPSAAYLVAVTSPITLPIVRKMSGKVSTATSSPKGATGTPIDTAIGAIEVTKLIEPGNRKRDR